MFPIMDPPPPATTSRTPLVSIAPFRCPDGLENNIKNKKTDRFGGPGDSRSDRGSQDPVPP